MIKKTRKVEKKNTTDTVGRNTISGLEVQESGGIRSREEFAGTELSWTQKIVTEVKGTEMGGDDFLE